VHNSLSFNNFLLGGPKALIGFGDIVYQMLRILLFSK